LNLPEEPLPTLALKRARSPPCRSYSVHARIGLFYTLICAGMPESTAPMGVLYLSSSYGRIMKTAGNTVLITGGATGIGLALAESFLEKGNDVIICGRREEKLAEARKRHPALHSRVCDVADEGDRESLLAWITSEFSDMNILVNNAGIQRETDFRGGDADLKGGENEVRINLEATVYLSAMFIPQLSGKRESAIINISSGLAFVPIAIMPVYCATKAAIHSFSLSLRHQLSAKGIRVFEIIAPTVNTELDRGAREKRKQKDRGIPAQEVASAAMKAIENDEFETAIGMAQNLMKGSMADPAGLFKRLNG
jgi:uncharacterized oxidoreductase